MCRVAYAVRLRSVNAGWLAGWLGLSKMSDYITRFLLQV